MGYNFGLWTVGYLCGLQFTHFDHGFMRGFSFSPNHMRNWGAILWTAFIAFNCVILAIFSYLIYLWVTIGRAWLLFSILAFELVLFFGVTFALKKTHYLHLHHYTIAMLLIPFPSVQDGFLTFVGAYCNGVMIEGGSRWGYDPIWIRRKTNPRDAHPDPNQI